MRALVTGGRGFVGRHLVDHLIGCGDAVTVLDHADGGADITDAAAALAAITEASPEVVYHLAGWADVGASWRDPQGALVLNAIGTLNVLEASRHAGTDRVVCVASAEVYGVVAEADLPLDEQAPLRPTSPYAASKVAAEALAHQAYLGYGLGRPPRATVQPRRPGPVGAVRGPGAGRPHRPGRARRRRRRPRRQPHTRRDLTDVRDVVRAYRLLALKGDPGDVYNVCSGLDVAIQELADRLLAMAERPLQLEPDPELVRPVDLPVLRGDPGRLQAATGWQPEIPLDQTLHDLLDDLRARVGLEAPTTEAP